MKKILLGLTLLASFHSFASPIDVDFGESSSVRLLLEGSVTPGCSDFTVFSMTTVNLGGLTVDEVVFDYNGAAYFSVPKSNNKFYANMKDGQPTDILTIKVDQSNSIVTEVSVVEIRNGSTNSIVLCK